MSLYDDNAVVLRRLDYSETSQVLVMFTRSCGKVRCIAKGIKRGTRNRFAAAIDLLEIGHAVWSARPDREHQLALLVEWKQQRPCPGLREQLGRLYAAQYAGEVTCDLTADADPHPGLYDALVGALEAISTAEEALIPLSEFQRRLLLEIGLMPRTDACVACRREIVLDLGEPLHFTAQQGGLICRDCEGSHVEKRRVGAPAAGALSAGRVTAAVAESLFDLLNYHIAHILHREPRLAAFVLPAERRRRMQDASP